MCRYEKDCNVKKVERVITEYSDITEDQCERNELSCDIYRMNRYYSRQRSVTGDKKQLRIAC